MNHIEKITEVFCFIAIDEDGEGVICQQIQLPNGMTFMPFICADKIRMESLKPLAKDIAQRSGKKIKLIRLTNREEIEDIS